MSLKMSYFLKRLCRCLRVDSAKFVRLEKELEAVHKRRPHKIAKNGPPCPQYVRTGSTSSLFVRADIP